MYNNRVESVRSRTASNKDDAKIRGLRITSRIKSRRGHQSQKKFKGFDRKKDSKGWKDNKSSSVEFDFSEDVGAQPNLQMFDFEILVKEKIKLFQTGTRRWLFDLINDWVKSSSKLFGLLGSAGTGKSVISGLMVDNSLRLFDSEVIAHHFICHDNQDSHSPSQLLTSLIAQMCTSVQGFKTFIEKNYNGNDLKKILSKDIKIVFEELMLKPLISCPCETNKVILIDGLDELPRQYIEPTLALITKLFIKLPAWVKIFTTSREYPIIVRAFQPFEPIFLRCDNTNNLQDLKIYLTSIANRYIENDVSIYAIEETLTKKYDFDFSGSLHNIVPIIEKQKLAFKTALETSLISENERKSLELLREIVSFRP